LLLIELLDHKKLTLGILHSSSEFLFSGDALLDPGLIEKSHFWMTI